MHHPLRAWLLALLLVLTGCASSTTPTQSVAREPTATDVPTPSGRGAEGTLRIVLWQAPNTLNPHLSREVRDWEAARITYEPLASFDKDGTLVPILAAEIPSRANGGLAADGRSVTWHLKPGVRWSDGEPFTADDVRFTYQYAANPQVQASSSSTYSAVQDVKVIDATTVQVLFKDVNPAWVLPFVGVYGAILPRHVFERFNGPDARTAPPNLKPVGTGPYRMLEIKPQEVLLLGNELVETNKIVFEANPFFREVDKPAFSRLELRGGGSADEAARLVLQTGDVDFAWNLQVSPDLLAKLEPLGKGHVLTSFGPRVERIMLNRTDPRRETSSGERSSLQFPHPFFNDLRVRQAFALAIDRTRIAEQLYGMTGRPTSNNLAAPDAYASPNTSFEYNLDKARALLDAAGWHLTPGSSFRQKDGVTLRVLYQTTVNPVRQQIQQIVRDALQQIGVEVELKIIDAGTYTRADPANTNNYFHFYADMQEQFVSVASPDPGEYMRSWTCGQIPQQANGWTGVNIERWCNHDYDALYKRSTVELDPEQRRQIFIKMNDLLINDIVMIPVVNIAPAAGVSADLAGVDLTAWDANTWNIKDWRQIAP